MVADETLHQEIAENIRKNTDGLLQLKEIRDVFQTEKYEIDLSFFMIYLGCRMCWEFGVNVALGLGVADLCSRYGKLQFAFVPSTQAQSTFLFWAQAFLAQREILLMVIPFGRFKTF